VAVSRDRWDGVPKCTEDVLERLEAWGRETARGEEAEPLDPLLVLSAAREVRRLRAAHYLVFDAVNAGDLDHRSARTVIAALLASVRKP
jgi:hypothetical protein